MLAFKHLTAVSELTLENGKVTICWMNLISFIPSGPTHQRPHGKRWCDLQATVKSIFRPASLDLPYLKVKAFKSVI